MKKSLLVKFLVAVMVLLGSAKYASADTIGTISLIGADNYNGTTITFLGNPSVAFGSTTDSFNVFTTAAVVTPTNFTYNPFTPGMIFTITQGANTLSIYFKSLIDSSTAANSLSLHGIATLTLNGVSNDGDFTLSTQGGMNKNVSFSATALAPTPEPSTLFLLGTGLVGSAGAFFRRRQTVTA